MTKKAKGLRAAELLSRQEKLLSMKEDTKHMKYRLKQERENYVRHAARAVELASVNGDIWLKMEQQEAQRLQAVQTSSKLKPTALALFEEGASPKGWPASKGERWFRAGEGRG